MLLFDLLIVPFQQNGREKKNKKKADIRYHCFPVRVQNCNNEVRCTTVKAGLCLNFKCQLCG